MGRSGRLVGRTAIVTGGASGIGEACVKLLADEGANVIVSDIDEEKGRRVEREVNETEGATARYVRHDVVSEDDWVALMKQTVEWFGGLNILVNNAGIGVGGLCEEFSLANWQRQIAVNMDGVFLGTKHAIPVMRATGNGSIIIMSSGAGLKGTPGMSGYCATKAGVRLFAKAVALELAGKGDDIRVNSVHPGLVATPIWAKVDAQTRALYGEAGSDVSQPVDVAAIARSVVPGGRLGQPMDIAEGVLYLASDASRYVTGSELVIDGGATAG